MIVSPPCIKVVWSHLGILLLYHWLLRDGTANPSARIYHADRTQIWVHALDALWLKLLTPDKHLTCEVFRSRTSIFASLQRAERAFPSSLSIMQIFAPLANVALPLRILTHNIRYAATSLEKNEKPWPERLPLIVSELSENTRFLARALPTNQTFLNQSLRLRSEQPSSAYKRSCMGSWLTSRPV